MDLFLDDGFSFDEFEPQKNKKVKSVKKDYKKEKTRATVDKGARFKQRKSEKTQTKKEIRKFLGF